MDLLQFRLKEESWLCAKTVGYINVSTNDLFHHQEKLHTLSFVHPKSGKITGNITFKLTALNFGWAKSPGVQSNYIYIEPLRGSRS